MPLISKKSHFFDFENGFHETERSDNLEKRVITSLRGFYVINEAGIALLFHGTDFFNRESTCDLKNVPTSI